jgi:hypothetical protein
MSTALPTRYTFSLLSMVLLALAACTFDHPLAPDDALAIDPALLGRWDFLERPDETSRTDEALVVLRFSPTEYLVEAIDGDSSQYFRAWPAEIGGKRFVQLELLGSERAPEAVDGPDRYAVVAYRIEGDSLVVSGLNTDLVDADLGSTAALRAAFEAHLDAPDLFAEPDRYRRVPAP